MICTNNYGLHLPLRSVPLDPSFLSDVTVADVIAAEAAAAAAVASAHQVPRFIRSGRTGSGLHITCAGEGGTGGCDEGSDLET